MADGEGQSHHENGYEPRAAPLCREMQELVRLQAAREKAAVEVEALLELGPRDRAKQRCCTAHRRILAHHGALPGQSWQNYSSTREPVTIHVCKGLILCLSSPLFSPPPTEVWTVPSFSLLHPKNRSSQGFKLHAALPSPEPAPSTSLPAASSGHTTIGTKCSR